MTVVAKRRKPAGTGPLLREPLVALGYVVETVERVRRVPDHARPGRWKIWTEDYLGMIDDLAYRPGLPGVVGFQRTVNDRFAEHVAKVVRIDATILWSDPTRRLFVVGFRKRGRGDVQTARCVEVRRGQAGSELDGHIDLLLRVALAEEFRPRDHDAGGPVSGDPSCGGVLT